VQQTARAVLETSFRPGEPRFDPKTVPPILSAELAKSVLKTPARSLAISVGDGSLKVEPFALTQEDGSIRVSTVLDIVVMRLDSEWTLEPKPLKPSPQNPRPQPLPAVSVIFSGPLAELARLEPRIVTDRLEQELTIRRAERDVELLERLKLKEERLPDAEPVPQRTHVQGQPPEQRSTAAPQAPIVVPTPLPAVPTAPATLTTPPAAAPPPPGTEPQPSTLPQAPRPRPRPPKQTVPDWQTQAFPR
jgi:hypothetical protein